MIKFKQIIYSISILIASVLFFTASPALAVNDKADLVSVIYSTGQFSGKSPIDKLAPNESVVLSYTLNGQDRPCTDPDRKLFWALRDEVANQWAPPENGSAAGRDFSYRFDTGAIGSTHTYQGYFYCYLADIVLVNPEISVSDLEENLGDSGQIWTAPKFSMRTEAGATAGPPGTPPGVIQRTEDLQNPLQLGNFNFDEPGQIVQKVLVGFAGVIGVIAIAFVVFNAFKLIIATNEESRNEAKQGLTWSVGGFVVALLSFTLVAGAANFLGFDPSRVPTTDTLVNPIKGPSGSGAAGSSFFDVLGNLMVNFLGLVGFATTLLIIYYGYRYMTSAGNEEAVESAKVGLRWSVIGFIIALLAFTIITALRQYLVLGRPMP